jgi:glycine/sarcosine N-methyltransferase
VSTPLYDDLSVDYDRFVNWERRLAVELPLIEQQLEAVGARRVLDAACGTGQHAIALAQHGYEVAGADVSEGMIAQARRNAAAQGAALTFVQAGFGHLALALEGPFDAVLCLGNSLPHVLTREALAATLHDWAMLLRPGGLLFVQTRNFDRVLATRDRWMPPQAHREEGREWLFVRFYDFHEDGSVTFHMLRLFREAEGLWDQRVSSTELWPWRYAELVRGVKGAGYVGIHSYGDMQGHAWDADSPNLIVSALKARGTA